MTDVDLLTVILSALAFLAALFAAVAVWVSASRTSGLEERLDGELERLRNTFDGALRDGFQAAGRAQGESVLTFTETLHRSTGELDGSLRSILSEQAERDARRAGDLRDGISRLLGEAARAQAEASDRVMGQMREEMARMRRENEASLEKIRATVDEKLHETLETRLGESFRLVSERLEQVHRGLGEMRSLASGVGDLKRVLTNVRSRGTFGEVQLGALLEQVLTPGQYDRNVVTVPHSGERVEFAIRLPGRDDEGSVVHLPIDAKFPQEDYLRLQEAYEAGDPAAVEGARKALKSRLLAEAGTIRSKYLSPPHTTDFALLFVPTEGLYAEALRMDGLLENMQRKSHVVLVGPTTLYAVLNSLQMGFRTLAIEKRSSEVWKVLGAVKAEFGRFGHSLAEVKKKLREASNKIEFSERRSRVMERKLREVESLPGEEAAALLPGLDGEEPDAAPEETVGEPGALEAPR